MSKESEALAALDEALERVQAWVETDDENDAARLKERTDRLNAMVPAPVGVSHLPTDTLTGKPVAPSAVPTQPGPAAPETSKPEDNAPVQESESRSSTDPV